jgi:hypothetical protein
MSSPSDNGPRMRVLPASQLVERPVEWLWTSRLGFGKLAMLDGDPDQGKSLVGLDLCARLSRGREMPDGSPGPAPASSLILSAEDEPEDTVVPRLKALGADLDRVFVWPWEDEGDEPLGLPSHLSLLEDALVQTAARLLVLDPVTSFLDRSVAINSDPSVRRALRPLARLLKSRAAAGVLVRHLNKDGGWDPLYRGGGSIGLLASCRSGWLIGSDPEVPGRRVLAQVKNTLAPRQPSLAYELRAEEGKSAVPVWCGESPWTARQLLAGASGRPPTAPERDRAGDFLSAFLKGGPRPVREVWEAARGQGLSPRTLHRARIELEVRSERVNRDGSQCNYWLLPGQRLPSDTPELDAALEALEKEYPRPTPLEDPEE